MEHNIRYTYLLLHSRPFELNSLSTCICNQSEMRCRCLQWLVSNALETIVHLWLTTVRLHNCLLSVCVVHTEHCLFWNWNTIPKNKQQCAVAMKKIVLLLLAAVDLFGLVFTMVFVIHICISVYLLAVASGYCCRRCQFVLYLDAVG